MPSSLDPRQLLGFAPVYRLWSRLISSDSRSRRFVAEDLGITEGMKILDIGCGPADMLHHYPPVDYHGFDAEPRYIEEARRRHGNRGTFHAGLVEEHNLPDPGSYDRVTAIGVLHHLDDAQAQSLFRLAQQALRPGGRLITIDGVFIDGQNPVARWLISRDRGEHVRTRDAYQSLAEQAFADVQVTIRTDLLRIPYTHCLLDCGAE